MLPAIDAKHGVRVAMTAIDTMGEHFFVAGRPAEAAVSVADISKPHAKIRQAIMDRNFVANASGRRARPGGVNGSFRITHCPSPVSARCSRSARSGSYDAPSTEIGVIRALMRPIGEEFIETPFDGSHQMMGAPQQTDQGAHSPSRSGAFLCRNGGSSPGCKGRHTDIDRWWWPMVGQRVRRVAPTVAKGRQGLFACFRDPA
jgi:hypothetical protein